jgi:hypothetical protein
MENNRLIIHQFNNHGDKEASTDEGEVLLELFDDTMNTDKHIY